MRYTFSSIASLALLASGAAAHTYVDHLINSAGAAIDAVRHNAHWTDGQRNSPIKELASPDMVCGFAPTQPAAATLSVAAGGKFQLVYGHDHPQDDIIAVSHHGPCNVYLAPQPADGSAPTGAVWFKIQETGYDAASNQWCTDKLIAAKGLLDVTIPAGLPAGNYVVRSEIGALHEADALHSQNPARGIQMYVSCAQIAVTGSGSSSFSPKVDATKELTDSTPGVLFNIYAGGVLSYPSLGPAIASASGSSGSTGGSTGGSTSTKPAVPAPQPTTTAAANPSATAAPAPPADTTYAPEPTYIPEPTYAPEPTTPTAPAPAPSATATKRPKCSALKRRNASGRV
ncbi:hypothetical protein HDU88_005349 [Geranomyces variabilis]|nr:hypothetical protein HDU88_005349 [Geranomyces variabilis]